MKNYILLLLITFISFFSCETEFTPQLSNYESEIVVEGYIEAGENQTPPYVILTNSIPFSTALSTEDLDNLFIHDADVRIVNGQNATSLTEVCLQDLSPMQQQQISEVFGINLNDFAINFCVYTDLSFSLLGEYGEIYELIIDVEETTVSGITSIPNPIPLDSIKYIAPPGQPIDSMAEMRGFMQDPAGETNFYRFFTQCNDEPMLPGFPSVSDDRLFNGEYLFFPLAKGISREEGFDNVDISTIGLFNRGDTVLLKWCTLDKEHFNFWNTLEFNAANQGPFSSYTRIDSNIDGGLGVWGGYAVFYYETVVPE